MPSEHSTDPGSRLKAPLGPAEIKSRIMALADPADAALTDNLKSHVPFIEEVSRYIIFSGGKRLRPAVFMLTAQAAGGRGDPRMAAIFEYMHAATLLHDDVVDEAGLRRGRPAARIEHGNDAVILVGDFLFSKSYSLAAEVDDPCFVRALTDCTTCMAEGQVLELLHTGDLDLNFPEYLEVIRSKTAVLIAAACQMGAIYAKASPEVREAFYQYGLELGLSFQMVDDALDYVGTQHEFGKPVGHDLAEGKITMPFIHARDTANPADRARLLELARQGKTNPGVLEEAKQIVRQCGGVEATYQRAVEHSVKAQAALEPLVGSLTGKADLDLLLSLPWYVVNRRT